MQTVLFFLVLGVCFILPPLFHLNIKPNEFAPGFIPLRMINADLKFLVVLVCMSLIIGGIFITTNLRARAVALPRLFMVLAGIFLFSVLLSNIIAHNPMRAWVSSLQWHIVPLLFVLCLAQWKWERAHIIGFVTLLLLGGVTSCLITLDQHYRWTDWSHRLVRLGYAGIIYNRNFAAEYHAPLIPLALGLFFYLRVWWGRGLCLLSILLVFLPAVSLSMARGAWVGHIGGAVGVVVLLLLFLKFKNEQPSKETKITKIQRKVILSFLLLGALLPAYLYTSDFWKKGGAGWDRSFQEEPAQSVTKSIVSKDQTSKAESPVPVISETSEARELKSIIRRGSPRRLVLWEDAFKECFSKDFLLGKGTDHYELFYHQSAELSDKNWGRTLVRFVHNDFIQTFYENGIVGIVGWLGIWGFVTWSGLMSCVRFYRNGDCSELGLRFGLIACIFCFLIESFFEFPTRSPCAMFVGWSSLGILLGLNLQKQPDDEINQGFNLKKRPLLNLWIGVIGVVLPIYSCFLVKDLFWANVYYFQGRALADGGKPQRSLHFHKMSISHAPWQHLSRKAEGFLLITAEKRYLDAMKSIEDTLRVHPGCLQAHQNRIALLINEFKNPQAARLALMDMKTAAPYHPFTHREEKKLRDLLANQNPATLSRPA
ncbi:MAG: O-antigen ligase family protein, partial [Opitutales bacterium]|nr:O-antigen ligase family protein [Opitutales bacterium]